MAYDISKIQSYTSTSGVFFFDTNIWIDVLAPKIGEQSSRVKKYSNFFEKVHKSDGGRISLNKLLLSELINTYMRVIAVKSYMQETNDIVLPNEFKSKYRQTQHYKDQYEIICDDIYSYSESFVYHNISDECIDMDEAVSLPNLDFNDYCYYKTALENELTLVTHDFDFYLEDVKILTLNDKLSNEQYLKTHGKITQVKN